MSRAKKLLLLLLVLALLGAAGLYFSAQQKKAEAAKAEEEAAQAEPAKVYAFQVDTNEITSMSWRCLSRSGAVERDGDAWVFTGENGEKQTADSEKMNTLLGTVRYIEALKKNENPEDMTQYGFEDPICEVTIETAQKSYELVFGDASATNAENNYFNAGDGCVYVVDGTLCEKFYLNSAELLPAEQ